MLRFGVAGILGKLVRFGVVGMLDGVVKFGVVGKLVGFRVDDTFGKLASSGLGTNGVNGVWNVGETEINLNVIKLDQ